MRTIFLFLVLAIMMATESSAQAWSLRAPYDFALQGASGATVNGKIYIVGGVDNSGGHNELRMYDPATNVYIPKAPFPGYARQGAICFESNGYFYYGGGEGASFGQGPYTDMWKYDPINDFWTPVASVPAAFAYAASVVVNGKAYVLGGLHSVTGVINDSIRIYDPNLDAWTSLAMPAPMIATYGPAAFAINNSIYYGTGFSPMGATADFWRFDPVTLTVSQIAPFPGLPRSGAATFSLGELGFVIGGTIGCAWYADVFAYDVANELWIAKDSIPTGSRTCAVGVTAGGNGYVIAGAQNVGIFTQETYEYGGITTHVPDIASAISVKAYPNPAVGNIWLELPPGGEYRVTIYDASARLVQDSLVSGSLQLTLASGVYTARIQQQDVKGVAQVVRLVFQ